MNPTDYFKSHSLNPDFLKKKFGWVWDDKVITIPIYNAKGKLLFKKYRNLTGDAKFIFDKGSHPVLYPLWLTSKKESLVVCEGEPDAARLWQEGIPAVTTVGGVASFNREMAAELSGKKISLVLDTDEEGQKNIPKYGKLLTDLAIPVSVISLPAIYKDVCEFFTANHTKDDFQALQRVSYQDWLFTTLSSRYTVTTNPDFMASRFPPNKWLVAKLLRASGISPLVGEGGTGKTALSYSLAKSISEGSSWLGKFPTTKSKILFLDKENENIDIQQSLKGQNINSENIYHYSEKDFAFADETTGGLSEQAQFLQMFVKKENISVIILDSLVDFFIGSENDSIAVAQNFLYWRDTFPDCAILVIHHENKPMQGAKRQAAKYRIKGNTHFYNGSQSALSFSQFDEEDDTRILVEHTKVRGAKRTNPFEIKMLVEENSDDPTETIITGFKYIGEVKLKERAANQAYDAIISFLSEHEGTKFNAKDIVAHLPDIQDRLIREALPRLRRDGAIASDISKQPYMYWNLEEREKGQIYEE